MRIVLDVNVLLSALIRDSTTRSIIIKSEFDFCFPEPSLHKIKKYQAYIIEKSGLSEMEYFTVLDNLLKSIEIIPSEDIAEYWDAAKEIMENIDPEDVIFIATALSQDNSAIWSEDKHFERQNKVFVLKTKDILYLLNLERNEKT